MKEIIQPGVEQLMEGRSKTIHGMLIGSASENRASALVNESMVCHYSEEFNACLRKHYDLSDKALQFFVVHSVADQEHTKMAADVIARHANTDRQQELVRDSAATWFASSLPNSRAPTTHTSSRMRA
jgi:hypothetical protein